MKRSLLLAVSFAAATFSFAAAPPERARFSIQNINDGDSLFDVIPTMNEMLKEITTVMGLQNNFELQAAEVLNIEAAIQHKRRMILYNPVFIDWINKVTGNKWGTMALLAHEMGHHLNGHTMRRSGSEPQLELEADEFAGFVLEKLGASLVEAQEVMKFISTNETTRTHPARNARLLAVQNGWSRAVMASTASVPIGENLPVSRPRGTNLP